MRTLNDRIAALRGRIAAQEGLSIIEMAVALGVIFISLLALARTATVAFSDTANSRQRQTGNQLANQLLEQVAGLPWETVTKGLATSDLNGDSNIVSCSGVYRYKTCTGEQIEHTDYPVGTAISPLVPHTGSVGPPEFTGTYSWRIYVTEPTGLPTAGGYRIIAMVDWTNTARQGVRSEVEAQTLRYSPSGCVDSATHTFSGPCSAYFYGTGRAGGGTINTTGTWSDGDEPFDSLTMTLLAETADAQVENISKVEGDVSLPTITKILGDVETSETESTASAADTDPATPASSYSAPAQVGPQSSGTIQLNDSGDKLTMSFASGATGKSTSATAAGGSSACNGQIDGQACGFSTGTQAGAMSQTIDLKDPGLATLVSVGESTTPVTTYVRREVPVAGQNGLIRETVTWNLPEIRIGGIPSAISPSGGWLGYWVRLTGFSATATAESGLGTVAPTVTISGGTIEAWHGNGYNSYPVTAAGGNAMISSVSQKTKVNGEFQQVDISGEVSWEPSTIFETILSGAADPRPRSEAKATIGSPLVVEMNYAVMDDDVNVANLTIQVTAGRGEITTRYQAGGV
jgi:hypothetical protein